MRKKPNMTDVSAQLKEFRGTRNMIAAAKAIGIPVATYRHLESGRKAPNAILLLTRIKYLEFSHKYGLPDIVE